MRDKILLAFIAAAFAANTNAEDVRDIDNGDIQAVKSNPNNSPYVGLGVYIGHQRSTCRMNDDFTGVNTEVNSTPFGAVISAGIDKKISGNFSLGVEAGVDFGSKGKKHAIGSVLSKDSAKFKAVASNVNKILTNVGSAFAELAAGLAAGNAAVSQAGYENFVRTLRYIGGDNTKPNPNFVRNSVYQGLYDSNNGVPFANPNLVDFVSFDTENGRENPLTHLASTNEEAVEIAREFVTTYYPEFAAYLRNMQGFGADVTAGDADVIRLFFSGRDLVAEGVDLDNLGIDYAEGNIPDLQQLRGTLNQYVHNLKAAASSSSTSFGVSPRLLVKGSYYMPEADATISLKAGAILVNGTAYFTNGIGDKNFRRIAPMAELSMEKALNDKFGVSVGLSHVFQTTKKFDSMKMLGTEIQPKVKVQRTSLGVTFTYRFK